MCGGPRQRSIANRQRHIARRVLLPVNVHHEAVYRLCGVLRMSVDPFHGRIFNKLLASQP